MERELLFCLKAAELAGVSPEILRAAAREVGHGDGVLRDLVIREAKLAPEVVARIEAEVETLVAAHGGDVHLALESVGGQRRISESFGDSLEPGSDAATCPSPMTRSTELAVPPALQVTPEHSGRYDVKGEIGRGGIGRVLVAFDEHVGREVAIKELLLSGDLRSGTPSDPTSSRSAPGSVRFLREARLTAQLEHPSIVPVYEVGSRADGALYYTMRLVRGRTLAQALNECRTVSERLRLLPHFASLCAAVAYAHSRGVLHRDLKPHNTMIGEFGETVLLDWGLARAKGSDAEDRRFARKMEALREVAAGHTVAGTAMGTPEYMSPEQANGDLDAIDEHSDVYSLGAVLYELLTGRPPFEGTGSTDTIGKVQAWGSGKATLDPVRSLEPSAPPELAAIAQKALFPQPHGRYAKAKALLDDVNAFMSGERVAAYEYTSWELLRRFVARNRAVSALAAALLVVILAGAVIMAQLWREAVSERAEAQRLERLAHTWLSSAYAEKAARLSEDRDHLAAQVFAAAALRASPFNPLGRGAEDASAALAPEGAIQIASLQSTLYAARQEGIATHAARLGGHTGMVRSLAFSPDGRLLASGSIDRTVRIWDVSRGVPLSQVDDAGAGTSTLAFSPDGKLLAVAGMDRLVRLADVATGKVTARLEGHTDSVTGVAFSLDGARVSASGRDGTVRTWSLGGRGSWTLRTEERGSVEALVALSGGSLAAAGPGPVVRLWPAEGSPTELAKHEGGVLALGASPSGRWLASLGADQTARVFDAQTGQPADVVALGDVHPRTAAFWFDEGGLSRLALARDDWVEVWDAKSGQKVAVLHGHEGPVRSLAFSQDGSLLATGGTDRVVHLWRLAVRPAAPRLCGHAGEVTSLALSPDGRLLVSAAQDATMRFWTLPAGTAVVSPKQREQAQALAVSPDGRVASADRKGTVVLWDSRTGLPRQEVRASGESVSVLAFSGDGTRLAIAGREGVVGLWWVPRGEGAVGRLAELKNEGSLSALGWSADSARLAFGGREKQITVLDGTTLAPVWQARLPETIRALAFSPDGKLLATSDSGWSVRLWDAATGKQVRELAGHRDTPRGLSFSADGSLLASAGMGDGGVLLWDVRSGRALQRFAVTGDARAAALSPDGRTLLVASGPEIVLYPLELELWRQDPSKLLLDAERDSAMRLEGFELKATGAGDAR